MSKIVKVSPKKSFRNRLIRAILIVFIVIVFVIIGYLFSKADANISVLVLGSVLNIFILLFRDTISKKIEKGLSRFNFGDTSLIVLLALELLALLLLIVFAIIPNIANIIKDPTPTPSPTPFSTPTLTITPSPSFPALTPTPVATTQKFSITNIDSQYRSDTVLCGSNANARPSDFHQETILGFAPYQLNGGTVRFKNSETKDWVFIQFNNPKQIFVLVRGGDWPPEYEICGIWSYYSALSPQPDLINLPPDACGDLCKPKPLGRN